MQQAMATPIETPAQLLAHVDTDALRAIVARIVGGDALEEVTFHLHRSILGSKGYNALKCVISAEYRTARCVGWVDLLLKWSATHGESDLYPILMAQRAPVPRLEGIVRLDAVPEGASNEVMVLEFLPHIGHEEADLPALATSLGRFNAMRPELFPKLPDGGPRQYAAQWITLWSAIQRHAQAGELGEAIGELCRREQSHWDRFESFVASALDAADGLSRGVIHRDVSIQNTGWRQDRRELLLFDVPQMAAGPIAQDAIALFPEELPFDRAIADRYLAGLRERGGPELSPAELRREVDTVRPLNRIGFYAWSVWKSVTGEVDWTDDVEEGRRIYRRGLLQNLERTLRDIKAERRSGLSSEL